ncbi:hypothetical protein BJ165DRAFT_1520971 [Panaeolus papilionaceus]|nr:hypothetical protein BJ165DRAFT_1520971 [Panaeolus papilionaceus]
MPPTSKRNPSNLESLLLAQAVWELGANSNSWQHVAKLLSKHPLVSRPKSFFTPQSCHAMYEAIMKDAELEIDESTETPNAQINLVLAQKHYRGRFSQLKDLILAEETKFKTVLKEIEDIRSGNWSKEAKSPQPPLNELPPDNANVEADARLPGADSSVTGNISAETSVVQHDNEAKHLEASEEVESTTLHVPNTSKEDSAASPRPVDSISRASSSPLPSVDADKEATPEPALEQAEESNEPNPDTQTPQSDRREEEEEEEITREDDGKQEEEEASQGHQDDMELDQDNTNEVHASDSPTETSEAAGEPEEKDSPESSPPPKKDLPAEEDKADESSTEEEPVMATRRSTRHRKSSAASAVPPPPPAPRTRQRRGRPSDNEPQPAADSEGEGEAKDGSTSQAEDDNEVASARRREGKRKASTNELLDSPDKKRMREDSEALDDEEQGSASHNTRGRITRGATRTEEQKAALKRFQSVIAMLHQQISQHRNGNIFHNPIKNSEAPDYHDIVKRPMDLKTIKTRVKDGVIANSLEYQRDIYLMFANAMMYNRPGSDVHAMAEDMMIESEAQVHTFRQTEGLAKRQRP